MKSIANYLSLSRIFLALALLLTVPLSIEFYVIYLACGISDILDGYIARKTYTTSSLGEKLDSIGDFIMITILLIVLYPVINVPIKLVIWIVIIGIIRVISAIVALKKYKTFAMLHTYGNKFTGLILFAFPLTLTFVQSTTIIYIICVIASISAIEELLIQIWSNELDANRKSILQRKYY